MKIVVCIKQVPGTSQVEIDPETGVLKRDGAAAKINPYDLYALETAMRLKERCGGTVTAVTMGPPQAEAMMKEAYMMGVDQRMYLQTVLSQVRTCWQPPIHWLRELHPFVIMT